MTGGGTPRWWSWATLTFVGSDRVWGTFPASVLALAGMMVWTAVLMVTSPGLTWGRGVGATLLAASAVPFASARFRLDARGAAARGGPGRWRTVSWEDVPVVVVRAGTRGAARLEVPGIGPVHATSGVGCTRPLRILALAARAGWLPARSEVVLERRPVRPAGRRAVARIQAAGVEVRRR